MTKPARLPKSLGRRAAALLTLLLLGLLALAGCGSSSSSSSTSSGIASKTANEILAASRAASLAASSVHVESKLAQSGGLSASTDASLSRQGGSGRFTLGALEFELTVIGPAAYLKGNPTFYAQFFPGAHVPAGTWIAGSSTTGRLSGLSSLLEMNHQLSRLLEAPKLVAKGSESTIEGQQVIEVKTAGQRLFTAQIFIATTGQPYPRRVIKTGYEHGTIEITHWNQPVTLTAPTPTVPVNSL